MFLSPFLCFHLLGCRDDELPANRKNACPAETFPLSGREREGLEGGKYAWHVRKTANKIREGKMEIRGVAWNGVGRSRLQCFACLCVEWPFFGFSMLGLILFLCLAPLHRFFHKRNWNRNTPTNTKNGRKHCRTEELSDRLALQLLLFRASEAERWENFFLGIDSPISTARFCENGSMENSGHNNFTGDPKDTDTDTKQQHWVGMFFFWGMVSWPLLLSWDTRRVVSVGCVCVCVCGLPVNYGSAVRESESGRESLRQGEALGGGLSNSWCGNSATKVGQH